MKGLNFIKNLKLEISKIKNYYVIFALKLMIHDLIDHPKYFPDLLE